MKRNRLYIWTTCLLAVIGLMTACSSDGADGLLEEQKTMQASVRTADYLNVRIVSGSSQPTRATEQEENAIYDGILAIFEGSAANNATLKTAVVIDQLINNPGSGTSVNITQRLASGTHPYADSKRYVLALLNTTATGFTVEGSMLRHNGTSLAGKTIADIQSLIINGVGCADEHAGFYMASTIKSDGNILRLVEDKYLYDTPEAAAAGNMLPIEVERAAAKVWVSLAADVPTLSLYVNRATTATTFKVHSMRWVPDRYKTVCYALRNSASASVALNSYDATDFTNYWEHAYSSGDEVYVAENDETAADSQTRVIVCLRLKDSSNILLSTFYIYDGDKTRIFTTPAQAEAYVGTGFDAAKLTQYENGRIYDAYDILHDSDKKLERNNSYHLTLKTLTELGNNTAP